MNTNLITVTAQPDNYLMVSEKVAEKQTNNKFKLL